jgi:hypothetical protein
MKQLYVAGAVELTPLLECDVTCERAPKPKGPEEPTRCFTAGFAAVMLASCSTLIYR